MATNGIPPAFNIYTGALYEKDTAPVYAKVMSGQ
jgi:simple sugar transport system substrate-binding protein